MKVAGERAAIERTLREEQVANDSGFKSAQHSQATTEGRRGGQLRPPPSLTVYYSVRCGLECLAVLPT